MKFDQDLLTLRESRTVADALLAIERNQRGVIFTTDSSNRVTGILTDGDIRRAMLANSDLNVSLENLTNRDFVFAFKETSREDILKKLDGRVKVMPVLEDGVLVDLISHDHFPATHEQSILVRSRAPVRVSFGGGGSDVTHFFEHQKGAVLNAAVSLYAHSTMRVRSDSKIFIRSGDLNAELRADSLDEAVRSKSEFSLFQAILSVVRPDYGFELDVYSDFGIGSGLGGSASVAVSILGCFNALRRDQWTRYEIAELAFQAERLHMGVAGGWQDQYAAAFGGVNYIEFTAEKNTVTPLAIAEDVIDELQERLILCDTGIQHNSGDIHADQKAELNNDFKKQLVKRNVDIVGSIKQSLVVGKLSSIGSLLNDGWQLKRQFSSMISSPVIDDIYEEAIATGALGGKLLGAGGGGYFLFFSDTNKKLELLRHLKQKNLTPQPVEFDHRGLVTWKVRSER